MSIRAHRFIYAALVSTLLTLAVPGFAVSPGAVGCEKLVNPSEIEEGLEHILDKKHYEGFKQVALAVKGIVGNQPLIGIGRSPGPVTTFLSLLDSQSAIANLPISGLRSRPNFPGAPVDVPKVMSYRADRMQPLSASLQEQLFEHFDKTIASFLKQHSGMIYLLDLGVTGSSLFSAKRYLDLYASTRGLAVQFKAIALTAPQHENAIQDMADYFGVEVETLVFSGNAFIDASLVDSRWDAFAEFDEFDIQKREKYGDFMIDRTFEHQIPLGKGEVNPYHQRFRSALKRQMLRDRIISGE